MKFLQRLVRFVTSRRLTSNRNFVQLLNKEDNKLSRLYSSLLRGSDSDAQCAADVYGTGWEKFDSKYRVLKTRLQNRILDATFHIDFQSRNISKRNLAHYQCLKLYYQMNVLTGLYSTSVGVVLAKRLYALADKYSFVQFKLHSSITLLNYYALNAQLHKFYELKKREEYSRKVWFAEQEAFIFFQEFNLLGSAKIFLSDTEKERLIKYADITKQYFELYKTPDLARYSYFLQMMSAEAQYNYDRTIEVCNEAIQYFEPNPLYFSRHNYGVFILSQMAAYTCKGQYDNLIKLIVRANTVYKTGAANWFYLKQTEFQCLIRAQKYVDAVKVFNETVSHERFDLQPKPLKEKFLLFEFYLRFFIAKKEYFKTYFLDEELPELTVTLYPSRLRKKKSPILLREFVQYLPTLCKDDKGYLAPVSLALMLYCLTENDIENAIICEDSLQTFCRRRMNRNQPGYRTGCLINMIHQFVEAGLDAHKTRTLTRKWQKKMSNSVRTIDLNFDMEIIPFEHWWEMLLSTQINLGSDLIYKRFEKKKVTLQRIHGKRVGGKIEYAPLAGLQWKNAAKRKTKSMELT